MKDEPDQMTLRAANEHITALESEIERLRERILELVSSNLKLAATVMKHRWIRREETQPGGTLTTEIEVWVTVEGGDDYADIGIIDHWLREDGWTHWKPITGPDDE